MSDGTERSRSAFVQAALAGSRFAVVEWVDETGSTNTDLLARARDGAGEQVRITDLQTAGRGRRDRVWEAPSGSSILMSVLLRGRSPQDAFWSVGAVALAASQAIDAIIESSCTLKWPNDVMIGAAKAAGVLAQVVDDAVVVGIGINVNWPDEIPAAVGQRATAVNHHTAGRVVVDRPELAVDILRRAIRHLEVDAATLRTSWRAACSTLNQQVRLELEGQQIIGKAVDIAADGALVLERGGARSTHQVGDVVHLRPAK